MGSPKSSSEGITWRRSSSLQHGLPTDAVGVSSAKLKDEYDVIVIGAGFAGLTAARELSPRASVLILEARDRIGGRTWVAKVDGDEIEMGGQYVHWTQGHLYNEIVRYGLQKSITTSPADASAEYLFNNRGNPEKLSWQTVGIKTDAFYRDFVSVDGNQAEDFLRPPFGKLGDPEFVAKYEHLTSAERLDQMNISAKDRPLVEAALLTFGLGSLEHVGFIDTVRGLACTGMSGAEVKEKNGTYSLGNGGTTSLARAMLDDFDGDRLFGSPVSRLSQVDGKVEVTIRDGKRFKAKHVVCTIPLNVLHTIDFSPPLSKVRLEAISRGHIGRGGKLFFNLEPGTKPFFASAAPPCDLAMSYAKSTTPDGDVAQAVAFLPAQSDLPDLTDAEKVQAAYSNLVPGSKVSSYSFHDWRSDPFAQGTWTSYPAGFESKHYVELRNRHGNIFMASSDWAEGWRGYIDGAIEQGLVAAQEVKKAL